MKWASTGDLNGVSDKLPELLWRDRLVAYCGFIEDDYSRSKN